MHRVRVSDRVELERLLEQQRAHPPVGGLPSAARVLDLPLFIGDAQAAQDARFLDDNRITHVVSLGTGRISPEHCSVLTVDILDMEDQLLLLHFEECIAFLRNALADAGNAVLVHCVYGQSRSASICVAYLMAARNLTLAAAYEAVQAARPCIYINPGFLMQLQLFQRMGGDANLLGASNAHAELRSLLAGQDRMAGGIVQLRDVPTRPGPAYHCSKCNCFLAAAASEIHGVSTGTSGRPCTAIFLEPLKWMGSHPSPDIDFGFEKEGKLSCPKCAAKIGSWTWIGTKCQCGDFVSPAFQLVPSRIRRRG